MASSHPASASAAVSSSRGRRWSPLVAKTSAVLGLCFAVFYGWCLALVLRGLYSPTAAGDFCGTPGVLALTFGAVLFSPAALLLVAAIVLSRAGIASERVWQAVALAAVLLLLAAAATNWITFIPFLAP